jgi:alpha-tubulin suppressor-like RCC1 family protein
MPHTATRSFGTRWRWKGVRRALGLTWWLATFVAAGAEKTLEREKPEKPAGSEHTCAVLVAGGAKCWGANFSGQLGDGTNVNRNMPATVSGVAGSVSAIASGSEHTCALSTGGAAVCWGANFSGQLGDGTNLNRNTPVNVSGLSGGVSAVAAGSEHTCAVTAGGVKCWGANFSGQLGDGTNVNRNAPVSVPGLSGSVTSIAAGSSHMCALTTDGSLWCWGANFSGQLGDGTNVNRNTPVKVSGLLGGVSEVAAGSEHTCALTKGGALACWGANFSGQLGDGTNVNRNTPVMIVSGLSRTVTGIAAGSEHTCAVVPGAVKCWGANFSGQLGDGTNVNRGTPVNVFGIAGGVSEIVAGSSHTCALSTSGAMVCWGANFSGQLGDGTNLNRSTPIDVPGLPTVRPSVRTRIL